MLTSLFSDSHNSFGEQFHPFFTIGQSQITKWPKHLSNSSCSLSLTLCLINKGRWCCIPCKNNLCFSFKCSALVHNSNSRNGIKHVHLWESKASKIQASLNCHKTPIQSNVPSAFMKNEQESPKAEGSILLLGYVLVGRMQIWGGGPYPVLEKRDGCFICWLQANTTDLCKPCTWLSTELLWNRT